MKQVQVVRTKPGEDLPALAARVFNGDVSRFTEILDLNPSLDVFGSLPQELDVNIPQPSQILNFARPALSRVSQSLSGVGRYLSEAEKLLNEAKNVIPEGLQGYASEALDLVGEINGVVGDIEQKASTTLDSIDSTLRQYDGQLVQLVPWLLGRR